MERSALRDEVKLAAAEEQEPQQAEAQPTERYVAGESPAPAEPDDKGVKPMRTASQLAYEQEGSELELKEQLAAYVTKVFGGSYQRAFAHYDGDLDGGLDKSALTHLLADADVGTAVTRGGWVDGLLTRLDMGGDRKVQWWEFEQLIKKPAPAVEPG